MKENSSCKFEGVAPNKSERKACWAARDAFWDCLRDVYSRGRQVPDKLSDTVHVSQCRSLRQAYEAACPQSWVRFFDKQHDYNLFRKSELEEDLKERAQKA